MKFMNKFLSVLKQNWKWALLFLILPTLTSCNPSIGFPIASPIGDIDFEYFILIPILFINFFFGCFLLSVMRKNTAFLKLLVYYYIYEACLTIYTLFFMYGNSFGEESLPGVFTVGFWYAMPISTLPQFDIEEVFGASMFINLLVVLTFYIISLLINHGRKLMKKK